MTVAFNGGPGVRVDVTRGVGVSVGSSAAMAFVRVVVRVATIVAVACPFLAAAALLVGTACLSSVPRLFSAVAVGVTVGSSTSGVVAAGIQLLSTTLNNKIQSNKFHRVNRHRVIERSVDTKRTPSMIG